MRASRRNTREEIKKRSRVTKEQADTEGIGTPAHGIRLSAPSYTDYDHTSFLGVNEPVVEPDDRGAPPPTPVHPSTPDE